jgi:hypothetical protein
MVSLQTEAIYPALILLYVLNSQQNLYSYNRFSIVIKSTVSMVACMEENINAYTLIRKHQKKRPVCLSSVDESGSWINVHCSAQ